MATSNAPLTEEEMGWFHINDVWNLYTDGKLQRVHVAYVCIDETPDRDGYIVQHYDTTGDLFTALRLDPEEIRDVVGDYGPATDRPWYI